MSRLIESIRLYNGAFSQLDFHQHRINKAFKELFNSTPKWKLSEILGDSERPPTGLYKCRLTYDLNSYSLAFESYQPKLINSLMVVEGNNLNYAHKFEDRSGINDLFRRRGNCDDILILKQDSVTDTSFANIVFQKNNKWVTSDTPLLPGTMRQFLLDTKVISVTSIRKEDLRSYENFKLINSMLGWDAPAVAISKIKMNDDL